MDRQELIKKTREDLLDLETRFANAKRNLKIARRNFERITKDIPELEKNYYAVRNELKLARRKKLYLENPNDLYIEEFFSKRHKSMRNWEIKLGKSLVETFKIKNIVDFGCGLGAYLEGALLAGAERVLGYDIMHEKASKYASNEIKQYLYYANVGEQIDCGKFDCVLSIETAEHLAEEEADSFVDNLINASSRMIVLSASNAGGRYHINRQLKKYWIDKLSEKNFEYSLEATETLCDVWGKNGCPAYILRNLMVFYGASVN